METERAAAGLGRGSPDLSNYATPNGTISFLHYGGNNDCNDLSKGLMRVNGVI